MRQYGRDDVQFDSWYSEWMKQLAATYTLDELHRMLEATESEALRACKRHHESIRKSTSMQSCSARRAHARNLVEAAGERRIAIAGAIEIHELFPEHAKQSA
ncbi:hypothetical protein G0D86_29685 (plasmid) [Burkholderia multivorans]|uniref:hypothetical protein n=1 Tax=Burkholderia multivorans TaxID=87883 RepID=UPI0019D1529E|nr:hypothetical protein [Burkholderia multivorans]QSL63961.1 hypothetical protein G0D86_29685 [Burkholderia multivorans]